MKLSCAYCGTSVYVPEPLALGVARELRCLQCRTEVAFAHEAPAGAPTRVELFHGRYEKLGPPTASGQGFVYPAYDRMLRTFVVIKELTSPALRARFEQEVALAELLKHENIVALFESGESRDVRYLTMEYLEGTSLESLLQTEAPSYERAIDLLIMASEGLEYVHLRGVVHRDLKPENMFVTAEGVLKLMDFGHAKSTASESADDLSVPGTPGYTAPEQALSPSTVTPQADLWSLGAVAYRLLTGRLPYPELDEREAAREGHVPAPPSSLNPLVAAELDALVLHALAGRPEDRLADAGQFCERLMALRRKLSPQPLAASPIGSMRPGASASAPRLPPRTRLLVGIGAAAVVSMGALLLRAGREHAAAVAPTMVAAASALSVASTPEASVVPSKAASIAATRSVARAVAVPPAPAAVAPAVVATAPSSTAPSSTAPSSTAPSSTAPSSAVLPAVKPPVSAVKAQLSGQRCAGGAELVRAVELQLAHPRPRAWAFAPGAVPVQPLTGFCIDPRPVSVAAYARCVEAGSCPAHDEHCTPSSEPAAPMKCVSWQGAQKYCAAHGGALPSVAQWEAYGQAGSVRTDHAEWAKDAFPPAVFGARCKESNPALCDGHLFRKAGRVPVVEHETQGKLVFSWNRGAATSATGYDYVAFRCVTPAP